MSKMGTALLANILLCFSALVSVLPLQRRVERSGPVNACEQLSRVEMCFGLVGTMHSPGPW
jgi:hypothetical protein